MLRDDDAVVIVAFHERFHEGARDICVAPVTRRVGLAPSILKSSALFTTEKRTFQEPIAAAIFIFARACAARVTMLRYCGITAYSVHFLTNPLRARSASIALKAGSD